MQNTRRNLWLMLAMILTSITAYFLQPTHKMAENSAVINLEIIIPQTFAGWQLAPQQFGQIINPQQKEILAKIYTQTLSRTYINKDGDLIMLSIAYGADQSDAKQLHYPEVCYPAQGFQIKTSTYTQLKTSYGGISVKRLLATMGQRSEPLTYWTTIGDKVVLGARASKIEQVRYGFKGLIPDGMIVRVSTISDDTAFAYQLEEEFVSALVNALPAEMLPRITGLSRTMALAQGDSH